MVGLKVEEPVCVVSKIVDKDIIVQWSDLPLLVYYVVIAEDLVLQNYMFGEPALEKIVRFFL